MSARAEQRRQDIVEAAFDLFAERGYHATGIAEIAKRLQMSHGTFYRYFENKRDILDVVVTAAAARVEDAVSGEHAAGAATSLPEYRALAERTAAGLFGLLDDDPRVGRILLVEAIGVDAAMTARLLGVLEDFTGATIGYLEDGVRQGFLRPDLDARGTARALNGLVVAAALASAGGVPTGDRATFVDAAVRLTFDGIAA
jgi:AcrR family transcriptional regulator